MANKNSACYSGWDIGGAHLKVARCDGKGRVIAALELACPLWQGIDQLRRALRQALDTLGNSHDRHFVTMTGELVDIFNHRQTGVSEILSCVSEYIATDNLSVFSTEGWLSVVQARQQWQQVASMNWLASASYAALTLRDGLLMDIGSTTCDIVPLSQGQPQPLGFDDHQRQQLGELIYTGAVRTPLIALAQSAPFNGRAVSLAAELFASSGDVWCLLGELSADAIQDRSADGQSWQAAQCRQRLARLLGLDADTATAQQWQLVAQWFSEQQLQLITEGCMQVLSAQPQLEPTSPIIGAGIGRFIARRCAERLQRPYIDFSLLCDEHPAAADYAPATALALLAQQQFT